MKSLNTATALNSLKTDVKKEPDLKVSVIVPVYNCEKYLHKCLESLITQTYKNIEIICIDDGSTDRSGEMLEFFAKKDDRIKVIKQKNKGVSAARNAGLDVATGDYISFVDADDFVSYNAYEILTEVADEHDLDMIIFGGNIVPWREEMRWAQDIMNTSYKHYEDYNGCRLIFEQPAAKPFLWLHFVKRSLFEKPTKIRFNEDMKLGEDQLFQFNYVPRTKNVMVIDDKLYNYRVGNAASAMSMYGARKVKKVECHFAVVENVIKDWKSQGYFDTNKDGIASWAANFMYWTIVNFPDSFKCKYAKRILEIFEKNGLECYVREEERWCMNEFKTFALNDKDDLSDIDRLNAKIAEEKRQITETLKSKAFNLGRKFTKKKDRLDLSRFNMK